MIKTETINHPRGHVEKRLIDDSPKAAYKVVGLDKLEELIPDSVLIELEAIKANTIESDARRAAVTRVLNAMARGDKIDIHSNKFTILMTRLVTNTTLTGGQASTIAGILGA